MRHLARYKVQGTLRSLAIVWGLVACAPRAAAQERPAKRLANIVSVAVEEYGKAVDAAGRMVSEVEYEEAVQFLAGARDVAARMSGDRADLARALLDSLSQSVLARRTPVQLAALHARFTNALGADAALDLPTRMIDIVEGQTLYRSTCAQCHGARGRGDGPLAKGMTPPALPIGVADHMRDVTPATAFRIVSVGIVGTSMAAYASQFTPDQRWNIIAYVNSLRAPDAIAPGQGLYLQRCSGCHGPSGAGDGALAASLSKLPAELSSFAWQAERSDVQISNAVRNGVPGTSMLASRELSEIELAQLVGHIRTLALRDVPQPVVAATADPTDGAGVGRRVLALMDDALRAARAGRNAEAADRAFDSYIAFEPLETPARARGPGAVAAMERHFASFRGALKSSDLRAADGARNAVEAGMPKIIELTRPASGFWGNFLQSLLIILREGLEAILVVGAVVAFLIKTGHRERLRSIWLGVVAALVASAISAVVLATVLRALPATREIIEGVTMLVAVAVLFSVSYWLISKVEAAKWQQFIREKVNNALQHGGGRALVFVAFLAVYREGAETALFYQALLREGAGAPIALGVLVGFAALAVIFTLFYRYGIRIPLRPFFAVTSGLLYYMAFVFMGKGIRELQEGDVVPITVLPGWPSVDALGIFPSVETLLAQTLLLVLLAFALLKTFWPRRAVVLPTVPIGAEKNTAALEGKIRDLEEKIHAIEEARRDEQLGITTDDR